MEKPLSQAQTSWASTELSITLMSFSSLTQVTSQAFIFILSPLCHFILTEDFCLSIIVKTLKELAEGVPQVSTAAKLFTDAGLKSQLSGSEAFTLIAPQNDAFKGWVRGICIINRIDKHYKANYILHLIYL